MYIQKKFWIISYCLIFVLSNFTGIDECFAQSKTELEAKRHQTMNEITLTNKLLESTNSQKEKSLNDLLIVERRIKLRESVISNLTQEISDLEYKIEGKEVIIESLRADLEKVKVEYEKLVLSAFKQRYRTNFLTYILASKNLNQAHKRFIYLRHYTQFRKKQMQLIKAIQATIYTEVVNLENEINSRRKLVEDKRDEQFRLAVEKKDKSNLVADLKKKEKDLKRQLKEKEEIAKKLENEIRRIIEEESQSNLAYSQLTPEEKLLSSNFSKNKGRLPWPTRQGIITGSFGEQDHPILKGTKLKNNGVDITTIPGAEVRALFGGEVSKVIAILGANYTIIIRHGNFLTVYQNLTDVLVKPGDKVSVKQPIGRVYKDTQSNKSVLHLEIWEEYTNHNPESWLSKGG